MKLISESINDIDCKLEIFKLEEERLLSEGNSRVDEIKDEILRLEELKNKYIDNLSKMDGIEYRLYSYILKGFNPTKAIDKVAEENYLNDKKPTTQMGIMPYYKNMKKICRL